jgi:hypothetical protein
VSLVSETGSGGGPRSICISTFCFKPPSCCCFLSFPFFNCRSFSILQVVLDTAAFSFIDRKAASKKQTSHHRNNEAGKVERTSSAYLSRYSVIASCVGKSCSSSGKARSECCMSIFGRLASSRSYLAKHCVSHVPIPHHFCLSESRAARH